MAADGVHAAYLKATEGATFRDPRFEENWRGARAAGLQVGAYHFFTLCRGGAEQATNLLTTLAGVGGANAAGKLPIAVDLELSGNCSARPPRAQVQAEVDAFVEAVEAATGRPVAYYLLGSWAGRYPPDNERPHLGAQPAPSAARRQGLGLVAGQQPCPRGRHRRTRRPQRRPGARLGPWTGPSKS